MKQLLKLTPKGKFFFGGDRTFASERQSYYAHSEYFPQQTALLGMLRYSILKKEGALNKDVAVKAELIGNDFNIGKNNFQKIKCLSPVFILEDDVSWLPVGKDWQVYKDNGKNNLLTKLTFSEETNLPIGNFEAKQKFDLLLAPFYNGKLVYEKARSISDFFETHEQVGNEKARDGITKDDAFYKHDLLSFKRCEDTFRQKYSFGLWVETDNYPLEGIHTAMLGRESDFKVDVLSNVEDVFETISNLSNQIKNPEKIVLLSNSYIEDIKQLRDVSEFVLSGSPIPFRFIVSDKANNYYKMPKDNSRRSKQFYMLEKGTVIYSKNINKVREILDHTAFQTIGYNYYQLLNEK